MVKRKMSYFEKISLLTEYNPCHTYKKGARVVHDAKIYRAKEAITTPEAWTAAHWTETKYDEYVGRKTTSFLQYENIKVIPSAWYEWYPKDDIHRKLFKTYPFRAFLSCKGVTADMIPYVMFNSSEALTGKFSNIAESVNKGVYIYCSMKPTDKIIVPLVKCLKES